LKTTTRSQFLLITYIVKSEINQKGKPPKNGFALLKNDITGSEPNSKLKINSRYQRFDNKKGKSITGSAL